MTEQQPEKRKISLKLGLGILFLPYVFAWFLLRKGHGMAARVIGLSWAGLFVLMFAMGHRDEADRVTKQAAAAKPQAVAAPAQRAAAPASSAPQAVAKPPEVDIAAERAKNKALMAQIQQRLASNREHMKKFYSTKDDVASAAKDQITLMAIAMSRGLSKLPEDQKQATEAKALLNQVGEQVRAMYASSMEQAFVSNGLDAKVKASGRGNDRLTITYALMSKPLVYKFQNEWDLPTKAKEFGFKKLVYTNGFESSLGESWTVDL